MLDMILPALLFISPYEGGAILSTPPVQIMESTISIEQPAAQYEDTYTRLPIISAVSILLAEEETGEVIYAHHASMQREIASLTKVMTAVVALEHYGKDEVVTISQRAASTGGSSLHLYAGEVVSVKELIYGAMIPSGNDAAISLAEHAPLGEEQFYDWMNQKAKDLGMHHTHFVNPIGFDDGLQYSTAEDLLTLTRYARHTHTIMVEAGSLSTYTVQAKGRGYEAVNTNELLGQGVDGFKTGTTDLAGRSFIASFGFGERRYLLVILGSEDRFGDAKRVMEWLLWWVV